MKQRRKLILAFGAGALLTPFYTFGQTKAAPPLAGKLLITGSSSMAPLIQILAERFQQRHPGVTITVESGGSSRGVTDTIERKSDIGMVSRELNADEQALFAIPVARDGVVFAVHKSNAVVGLSKVQALAVVTGKITNWKALGGVDATIDLIVRPPRHGSPSILAEYLGIPVASIASARALGDNPVVIKYVSENQHAIAFLSTGAVDAALKKKLLVKPLRLDGKIPGAASIRDGSWPLSRPLNLVTRSVPTGLAQAFVQFALSSSSKSAILDNDFVPYTN